MGFAIIGVILIIVGAVCFYLKRSAEGKFMALSLTDTSEVKQLVELGERIKSELGAGNFRQLVEVRGKVECQSPLKAEFSGERCLYYKSTVEAEFEETYYEENEQTKQRVRKTRKHHETMSDIERSACFYINDGTGKIKVDPEKAEIDYKTAMDKFEPASMFSGRQLSYGNFVMDLADAFLSPREGRRLLGYHFREYYFPLDRNAFVLGEVSDSMGELTIGNATSKDGRFIISNKSEEELKSEAKSSVTMFDIAFKACIVLGIVLIGAGAANGFK